MNDWRRRTILTAILFGSLSAAGSAHDVMLATSGAVDPQLLTIDPLTHTVLAAVDITNEEALFGGLTLDGGVLYSIDGYFDVNPDRTFRVDASNGVGTIVGSAGANWGFRTVEIHPLTGVLYAETSNTLYTLDKNSGLATQVLALSGPTAVQITAIAIDPTGVMYGVDTIDTGLFRIDLTTGAMTHLGDLNLPVWGFAQDLAFDSSGQLWCVTDNGLVYTIDIANATATYQFTSNGFGGIAFAQVADPVTYCTSGSSASGCSLVIASAGLPIASASGGFTLACSNVDAHRSGIFFYGVSNPAFVSTPWGAGGTSYLCVQSPTQRMPVMESGGASGCSGAFAHDWSAFLFSTPTALGSPRTIGASFDAQLWMRDPPSPKTSILSNALRFRCCP